MLLPRAAIVVISAMLLGADGNALAAEPVTHGKEPFEVTLRNPSFTEGVDSKGVPRGWSKYGGSGKDQTLTIVDGVNGRKSLLIRDGDPAAEVGVSQAVRLQGGETYQATVQVGCAEGLPSTGVYLQLRFLPSNQFVQTNLAAKSVRGFSQVSLKGAAPSGTTQGVIYLYTHKESTPKGALITDVRLQGGFPPPPPPPPAPAPPQYDKLKNLHLEIPLASDGKPAVAIVVPPGGLYQNAAEVIQKAIEKQTGVTAPIVSTDIPEAAVPIRGNLIVLGNRSTNKTMGALYDLYYCLVDLKYPGPEGYVVRSVHNPFGNGHSVVIVGGSDAAGVEAGAAALAGIVAKATSTKGKMSIGWTMATRLGKGVRVPTDIKQFETWEASKGYGSIGYFGWCSISKRMAMYYMTGDEASAREVIRLSFPDKQALKDIETIDEERIENKHDPLAGFYHYNAHMAILFWDLIEESPVFSDAERLKVTNAFARQLDHRKGEGIYPLSQPPTYVGTRHGQWSAISLYCLGRYFNKDYPNPIWTQCVRAAELAFQPLHEHAWVAGENDNLFWYNTSIAPVLTYLVLSGDRKPIANGVLGELLRGQEILLSGRVPDWALNSAAVDLMDKAAYLTGDGRWITYRDRTGVDAEVFRLGQSFWPDGTVQPKPPVDLVDQWSIRRLPLPAWRARGSGLPFDQSFYYGSYRSAADATGDFILLKGFNGASRNPYHTFDILELRLGGRTLLQGFHNQVLASADGMVEPAVAMDAALLHSDVVGSTATAVGEVPKAAFCTWRRLLAHRTGRYTLVVDDLAFRTDSRNMKVATTWQTPGGAWSQKQQAVRFPANAAVPRDFELRSCDVQQVSSSSVVTMNWTGAVRKGEHRIAFYLIGSTASKSPSTLACVRLAENAAMMTLPQRALAVVGEHGQTKGELVLLAEDHLHGRALSSAGIEGPIVSSDVPVDIDWDFAAGTVGVVAAKQATLRMRLKTADQLRVDGQPAKAERAEGFCVLRLPEGRHVLSDAVPASESSEALATSLASLLAQGQKLHAQALAGFTPQAKPAAGQLPLAFAGQVGGKVAGLVAIASGEEIRLGVAEGNTIHLLTLEGKEICKLRTEGKIRTLCWWDDHKLLLAGCVDEKLIAFDLDGQRKWVFTSEMDPAVYEAAKSYWFKSAPGLEGIHGLITGGFDEGKSRCFVGSACTLEIVDETGKLVKRTPVFWGPGSKFLFVPARDGSTNLLVARWPNGNDSLATVNSKTMVDQGRGYDGVPAGHTFVGGWTAQNRTSLRYEDLDGDGKGEIVTAVNGTWNRVTIYSRDGHPLHNAQFGPGASTSPRAQMRDLDVVDLNGDGKKELLVALAEGLVVALSNRCEKVWSTRMECPPLSLAGIAPRGNRPARVVVACDNGTVAVLDHQGVLIGQSKVTGRPMHRLTLQTPAGPVVVLATEQGDVRGFRIGE